MVSKMKGRSYMRISSPDMEMGQLAKKLGRKEKWVDSRLLATSKTLGFHDFNVSIIRVRHQGKGTFLQAIKIFGHRLLKPGQFKFFLGVSIRIVVVA